MRFGSHLQPCGSCPYRKDVPSGIWHESEYRKLPLYDLDTASQPPAVFMCHQQNGCLCSGWVAVHDMSNNLGLRFASFLGMDAASIESAMNYSTEVPLFSNGREACAHGMREIESPSAKAFNMQRSISGKRRKSLEQGSWMATAAGEQP